MTTPNNARKAGFLGRAIAVFGAASAAAAAVESGRRPRAQYLGTLGIDPVAFNTVGRR